MSNRFFILLVSILAATNLSAQARIGTGAVAELYQQYCVACHGENLTGGLGPNLVDDTWIHGGTNDDIARVIREGVIMAGMVPYGGVLSEDQILSLVVFLREMGQIATPESTSVAPEEGGIFSSQHHSFTLEKVAGLEDDIFWSVSFLPDGGMLLSQHGGKLYVLRDGELGEPIKGIPTVYRHGQGGLLEAGAHPDYQSNGWIYLAYSDRVGSPEDKSDAYFTRVVRGRISNGEWVDQEDIWHAPAEFYRQSTPHYGTRFVFKDGYLFFSVGDRGSMHDAQDLTRPNGKIHRIHDDGRIPEDNPFVDQKDAFASIWSYGHRNPQGMDENPVTGEIWATEHGPRGGDEVNWIRRGKNYGWPAISYGINYNGNPITDKTAAPGMEQPVHYWVPSIAVCGIDFYEGDVFPEWKHDLFVGGLGSQHLERFRLDGDKVVEHEIVFKGQGRVRDVSTGPDGSLYLILNVSRNEGPGAVYRLLPAD